MCGGVVVWCSGAVVWWCGLAEQKAAVFIFKLYKESVINIEQIKGLKLYCDWVIRKTRLVTIMLNQIG